MNKYIKRPRQMRAQLDNITNDFTDEQAVANKELYPDWKSGVELSVGEVVLYADELYRVIQAHTSQADWTPDVAFPLFVKISVEDFPQWKQPTGAHDAYNTGDKVTYDDKHWQSEVDANIWQPGVYGWTEV